METWLPFAIPWGIAIIGGGWTFLRWARRQSGKINTTDAAVLWEEARSMRQSERDARLAAEKRADDCEKRERLWLREQRENERYRHDR